MICNNSLLAAMDVKMARLYNGIKKALPLKKQLMLTRSQLSWLNVRRDCADVSCIGNAYQLRVKQLYDVIQSAPVCSGPIMRQPLWCDAGGFNEVSEELEKLTAALEPEC